MYTQTLTERCSMPVMARNMFKLMRASSWCSTSEASSSSLMGCWWRCWCLCISWREKYFINLFWGKKREGVMMHPIAATTAFWLFCTQIVLAAKPVWVNVFILLIANMQLGVKCLLTLPSGHLPTLLWQAGLHWERSVASLTCSYSIWRQCCYY